MNEAGRGHWRMALGYALLLAAGAGLFLLIRSYGESLTAPAAELGRGRPTRASEAGGTYAPQDTSPLLRLLVALVAVILTGRIVSRLFRFIGQPPVIGEVVAGILLGPSFLGEYSEYVLPRSVAPYLGTVAQLGVILYVFLVGLELNAGRLRERAHATVAIAHAGIVVPFLLGATLAVGLYRDFAPAGVPFTSFALFFGISLSVTAFPVLARILTDRGINHTDLGVLALGCAAAADVTAWCLLALIVGVAQAKLGGAVVVTVLAMAFVAVMVVVVRPLASRAVWRLETEPLTPGKAAWVFVAVLLSALATEAIGIHAIFGAFLLGAVIPHDSAVARELTRKLEDVATALLLPAFFAYVGMRTQIGLVSGLGQWLVCGLIILAATAGKFGGTLAAARLMGLDRRTAASLGVLMNTRGLMELIVLNLGLDLGVLSETLFAMMVLMALVTTMATSPVLQLLNRETAEPDASAKRR
jgi:Kef-type K+ transport system membrane component KefB